MSFPCFLSLGRRGVHVCQWLWWSLRLAVSLPQPLCMQKLFCLCAIFFFAATKVCMTSKLFDLLQHSSNEKTPTHSSENRKKINRYLCFYYCSCSSLHVKMFWVGAFKQDRCEAFWRGPHQNCGQQCRAALEMHRQWKKCATFLHWVPLLLVNCGRDHSVVKNKWV